MRHRGHERVVEALDPSRLALNVKISFFCLHLYNSIIADIFSSQCQSRRRISPDKNGILASHAGHELHAFAQHFRSSFESHDWYPSAQRGRPLQVVSCGKHQGKHQFYDLAKSSSQRQHFSPSTQQDFSWIPGCRMRSRYYPTRMGHVARKTSNCNSNELSQCYLSCG